MAGAGEPGTVCPPQAGILAGVAVGLARPVAGDTEGPQEVAAAAGAAPL